MNEQARSPFGVTAEGEPVERLELKHGVLSCAILTYGATLNSLCVPGRDGKPVDVVLGYDTLEEYMTQDAYLGAVVGRFANRIAKGRFSLNGKEYALAVNNGPNHLHGGLKGFSYRVWTVEELTADKAVLTLDSPDGEEGYPGHLSVRVTYTLTEEGLTLRYEAKSDADTPLNLTNHAYFNLSGHGAGEVGDHVAEIFAHQYIPTDDTSIPLGQPADVAGTPMDFTVPTPLGERVDDDFDQLTQARGYDHSYVVDGEMGVLRPAAEVVSPKTGIKLTVKTTLPGVQLYTANYLTDRAGKDGARYAPRYAFCLETQFFPDSPNQPAFPSAVLRAGEKFDHTTCFFFGET